MKENRSRAARKAKSRRRKILMLSGLVLVAGIIWGRMMFFDAPEPAAAGSEVATNGSGSSGPERSRAAHGTVHLAWPGRVDRNPFAIDSTSYARRAGGEPPVVVDPDPVEPPPGPTGPTIEELLKPLRLQGTSVGDDPVAVINGRTYRKGESVNGLVIKRIEQRLIVLSRGDVEVTLEM